MFWVPLLAGLVGLSFAIAVALQYRQRHKAYQATWAVALAMFAAAAGFEAAGLGLGWSPAIYKGYYLFGALLNVGWLAVGTVYLLAPPRAGHAAAAVMAVFSLGAVAAVVLAGVDLHALRATFPNRASTVPALLPAVINIAGTLVLVGGAAWSAYVGFRKRSPLSRVIGTAMIAAGALIIGADHSIAQLTGQIVLQPLSEAAGIVVMFAGYLAIEAVRLPFTRPQTVT